MATTHMPYHFGMWLAATAGRLSNRRNIRPTLPLNVTVRHVYNREIIRKNFRPELHHSTNSDPRNCGVPNSANGASRPEHSRSDKATARVMLKVTHAAGPPLNLGRAASIPSHRLGNRPYCARCETAQAGTPPRANQFDRYPHTPPIWPTNFENIMAPHFIAEDSSRGF